MFGPKVHVPKLNLLTVPEGVTNSLRSFGGVSVLREVTFGESSPGGGGLRLRVRVSRTLGTDWRTGSNYYWQRTKI